MGSRAVALSVVGFVRVDEVVRRMRADMVRSNMYWLLQVVADEFGGDAGLVMMGGKDRTCRQLRQIALYMSRTQLNATDCDGAAVFNLDRTQATRAVQAVEERRDCDRAFEERLERVEARIRERMAGSAR